MILMRFHYFFQSTALNSAVDNGKIEIVKLLLAREDLDINMKSILNKIFFNRIQY